MITDASTSKMAVISDLHLGNPYSSARGRVVAFIRWALANGYDLCVNGDGLDIAQASFSKLAKDVPEVLQTLRAAARASGRPRIFYVVGNHDIALEHFLADWGSFQVAPFLNVTCGRLRVRVEHGHLYDPFFVSSPRLYELCTTLAGFLLAIAPPVYRVWLAIERLRSRLTADSEGGIVGEDASFAQAAREIASRGFDAVVFGHTHHSGALDLGLGRSYLNPGTWMNDSCFAEISPQGIVLRRWDPSAPAGVARIESPA